MSFKDFINEDFICECGYAHSADVKHLIQEMAFQQNAFKKMEPASPSEMVRYLKELWKEFNSKKFGGQMTMPNIIITKMMKIEKFRKRGYWQASQRTIGINPRCFTAYELIFEVFLHEMCHQAVSEIDKTIERIRGGHGPRWMSWMTRVGLDPNRYDTNPNSAYMTPDEKQEYEAKKERVEKARATRPKIEDWQVREMMPATYYNPGKDEWVPGRVVRKSGKQRWEFVPVRVMDGWKIIPNTWFYQPTDQELRAIEKIDKWRIHQVIDNAQRKKDNRDARKDYRRLFGF